MKFFKVPRFLRTAGKLVGYFRDTLGLTDAEMEHYFGAAMRRIEEEEAAWA